MNGTLCFLKDGKWILRHVSFTDRVEASYSTPTESVLFDERGKPVHLVRRWQPKTLKQAIAEGAVYEQVRAALSRKETE